MSLMLREGKVCEQVLAILEKDGVVKRGHFVGFSRKHLNLFVDFEEMFENPAYAEDLKVILEYLAQGIVQAGLDPHVLIGPAEGGNKLAQRLAPMLEPLLGHRVQAVLTVKNGENFIIQADESQLKDRLTLVLDDVMTSGKSCLGVAVPARWLGAQIIGIVVVVDRERKTAEALGVPFYGFLAEVETKSWNVPEGEACDPCDHGVPFSPVNSHTREHIAKHGQPVPRIGIDLMT